MKKSVIITSILVLVTGCNPVPVPGPNEPVIVARRSDPLDDFVLTRPAEINQRFFTGRFPETGDIGFQFGHNGTQLTYSQLPDKRRYYLGALGWDDLGKRELYFRLELQEGENRLILGPEQRLLVSYCEQAHCNMRPIPVWQGGGMGPCLLPGETEVRCIKTTRRYSNEQ